ncbi:hypothetical protein JTE90_025731 [Oedothorax gibbosus]|uniref:ENPP1-3/EXOG-like endonuclease/phosphodiesterase domain-containing protein n=1 Tax=Oedothorax gibbosus TaxID=931172 RepID=A0AAV6UUI9_9ARAC|nr:hypothetical protein JTE90_025731 [Oedothorax gibbosus]
MCSWNKVITVVFVLLKFSNTLEANQEINVEPAAPNGIEFSNNDGQSNSQEFLNFPNLEMQQFEPDPPTTSNVPKEKMEYMFRVYATNCSCPQTKKQVDVADKLSKNLQHLPFGVPYSHEDNVTLRLLYNDDYITAFDLKYRIPMWTSFTIKGKKDLYTDRPVCWTGDARIAFSDTAQCGDYDTDIVKRNYIVQGPVFPLDYSNPSSEDQVAYITNSIPKSLNHTRMVETKLYHVLKTWAQESGELNVVIGPAFDLDHNGLRPHIGTIMRTHAMHGPLIVPTHLFVIATWCSAANSKINECDSLNLSAHSFLVPNKPFPMESTIAENILQESSTSVADIENLSGLTFYTQLPMHDAIRLRKIPSERQLPEIE